MRPECIGEGNPAGWADRQDRTSEHLGYFTPQDAFDYYYPWPLDSGI